MFTAISTAEINTGEPTSNTTATKIKDNFDDHEDRILDLEASEAIFPKPYMRFELANGWATGGAITNLFSEYVLNNIKLLSVDVFTIEAGGAGGSTIDVKLSTNNGSSFATVLSAPISVGTGIYDRNSGTLTMTSAIYPPNSILRIDAPASVAAGKRVAIYIKYEGIA